MSSRHDDIEVLILAGGLSHERDVSIRSGRRVADALQGVGMAAHVHDLDDQLLPYLRQHEPDVVWPVLHGSTGEDGSVRDVLDLAGVPYVGSDAAGSRLSWNKPVAKTLLQQLGARTPRFTTLPQTLFRELGTREVLDRVLDVLGLPLVVKPAAGGSALGVTVVHEAAQLPQAMVACFAYGEEALIEQHVDGVDVGVSVVELGEGPQALPSVEIVTDGAYDYDARYNPGRSEYFVPGRLSDTGEQAAAALAVQAHTVLGLRDLSRTDMIIDADGVPWLLDINVAPGMTETSLFPQAAEASSFGLDELYAALVHRALDRR